LTKMAGGDIIIFYVNTSLDFEDKLLSIYT